MIPFAKYFIIAVIAIMGLSSAGQAKLAVISHDQVAVNEHGIFAIFHGLFVELESLSSANDGLFVAVPISAEDSSEEFEICPLCRNKTYIPGRYCTTCGFPIWSKKMNCR